MKFSLTATSTPVRGPVPGPINAILRAWLFSPAGDDDRQMALVAGDIPTQYSGELTLDPLPLDSLDVWDFGVRRVTSQVNQPWADAGQIHLDRQPYGYPVSGLWYGTQAEAEAAIAAAGDSPGSYLTLTQAAALCQQVPALAAWDAASDPDVRRAALVQATMEIDTAFRYQGRKYAATQVLEFPRAAYEASRPLGLTGTNIVIPGLADTVWDWDATANAAVVPIKVKLATLHQANSILAGTRAGRLDDIHDGLAAQSTGSLSETYRQSGAGAAGIPTLCRPASSLMCTYQLRQGRLQ